MLGSLGYVRHVEKHSDHLGTHGQLIPRPDILIISAQDDDTTMRLAQETRLQNIQYLLLLHEPHAEDSILQRTPAYARLSIRSLTTERLHQALSRLRRTDTGPFTAETSLADRSRLGRVPLMPSFTPREQEALSLLAAGMSNKEIADNMGISEHGAKRHVGRLLAKLNCPNRTLAVTSALRLGLLTEMFLPFI